MILLFFSLIFIVNRWATRKKQEAPVFIHFEFDDYEGDMMVKEAD